MMDRSDCYIFVIDTEQYSGNFEREMCSYCTGETGECGVGDREAKLFKEEEPDCILFKDVVSMPDDNGCYRPASIYVTPGRWNDGLGSEYPDEEWGKKYTETKYKQSAKQSKLTGTSIGRYPAYQSVAIYFAQKPIQEEIDFISRRALKFAEYWKDKVFHGEIKITGFRIVKEAIQTTELWSKEA